MKMNKKGAEKYYILISLILGILLIGITFSWIFSGYLFDEEAIELQKCKKSILARSTIPTGTINNFFELKEQFPLECKTRVIEINEQNTADAEKIIADAIAACWALYDRGEAEIYSPNFIRWAANAPTTCFTCARIHFNTNDVKTIKTKDMLKKTMSNGQSYMEYLTANKQNLYLIQPDSFTTNHLDFDIDPNTPATYWKYYASLLTNSKSTIYPPYQIQTDKEDLHITLSTWAINKEEMINQVFFYQNAKNNIKDLNEIEIQNKWFGGSKDIMGACGHWDGINIA
jgi:hypothetical protein